MRNSSLIVSAAVAISTILGINAASAADLPARTYTKAPAIVADPVYNWTGLYVGGNIGGGWEHSNVVYDGANNTATFPAGTTYNRSASGFLGGVQAGYNWQFDPHWVVGIEGDYSWANINGSASYTTPTATPLFATDTTKYNNLSTVTARLGYAVGNWLFFGKGGWGWTNYTYNEVSAGPLGVRLMKAGSGGRDGWTAGAGVEYGFLGNWSVKLEYDYLGLRKIDAASVETFTSIPGVPPVGTVFLQTRDTNIQMVKAGLNYRFNLGGPVVAKY